jgi:hypothetical protein
VLKINQLDCADPCRKLTIVKFSTSMLPTLRAQLDTILERYAYSCRRRMSVADWSARLQP